MSLYTRARDAAVQTARALIAGTSAAVFREDGPLPFDPTAPGGYIGQSNGSNVVVDFLKNIGLGIDGGAGIRFVRPRRLGWTELDALHVDAIGRRIAELPGHEATREGYQVRPLRTADAERAQAVVDYLTARAGDLGLLSKLFEARWRRRTFGSCLVVAGTEDCFVREDGLPNGRVIATDFSMPLRRGAEVLWLRTFDARWYRIRETYGEGHPLCGQPRLYEVRGWDRPNLDADYTNGSRVPATSSTRVVHASRVWRDAEPEGWSIFDGLARELARLLSGAKGAEDALTGMAVPTFYIPDLAKKLARDEQGVRDQIKATNAAKSLLNAVLLGDGEKFEWQKLTLGGVSDIINTLGYILSAATGIPMTLLFGMSPGGFSGGESEERNWQNYIRSVQRELGYGVQFVLDLLLGEAGVDPDSFAFAIEWNKLVVLTDLEDVERKDKWSEFAKRTIDAGIVKPAEFRSSAFGGEGFSTDVTIDTGQEEKVQANLGATEAAAVLEMVKEYYAPDSAVPREAAIAYVTMVDPSSAATAPLLFRPRPAPAPMLGAGVADPALDEGPPERAPDAHNTWRTAKELAAEFGCTPAFVERHAKLGLVAVRTRTGRHGARQYAQEHVQEALSGAETKRMSESEPVNASDPAVDEASHEPTPTVEP